MSGDAKLLIVDDQASVRESLAELLRDGPWEVRTAESAEQAHTLMNTYRPELLITDLQLPGANGLELLKQTKRSNPEIEVIVITAFGTIETAVDAIKAGAFDFIAKPIRGMDLEMKITAALERRSMRAELEHLRTENAYLRAEGMGEVGSVIGRSAVMRKVMDMVARVASSDSTVLIRGESGTGKELVARALHMHGPRQNKPFIRLNTAAMPEGLLESELFGHERGAFTGAIKRKPGKFELAKDGTIFLDEIGDISPAAQVKLLRVLQERTFERVGGQETLKVHCRVLAATNQALEQRVDEGTFRQDLYYRLNVVPIRLPPLRDRKDDLPDLVAYFLNKYNKRFNRQVDNVPEETMARFMAYGWPGNIRELENLLERAVVLGSLAPEDLPQPLHAPGAPAGGFQLGGQTRLADHLDAIESALVEQALREAGGNKTRAAALLGMDRNLLRYKMGKYEIQ